MTQKQSEPVQLPGLSLKKILGLSSIYGITPILDRALALVLLPLFTNYLSTDQYGSLVLLYASANIIHLAILMGFTDSLAKIYWDYKGNQLKECLGTAWITTLVLNLIIGIPLIVFSEDIAASFFRNKGIAMLIIVIIARITLSTQSVIPMVVFRAREQKYHVLSVNLINIIVRVSLTAFFLIYLKLDILGVFLADICANIASLFIYIPALIKEATFSFRLQYLKNILTISPFQFLVELLAWIISLSDRLVIQHVLNEPSEVGVYAVGYSFGCAILFFAKPVYTAWCPYIYGVNSHSKDDYRKQMGQFLLYYILICYIAFLVVAIIAPDVIRILTPPFYHRAGSLVVVILLAQILAAVSNYFMPTFFLEKKMQIITVVYLISAILNVALNYILIPRVGIVGAAIATFVSYGVMCVLIFFQSQKLRRIKIESHSILLITLGTFCIWWLVSAIRIGNPFVSIAIKGCLLIICFGILILLYKNLKYKYKIIHNLI